MIFFTVGTNEARFDRLLRAVAGLDLDESLVIQYGHNEPVETAHAEQYDFLPFEQMVAHIRAARVVVTHAGVGSVLVSLANAKRPVVVPRRKVHGEAVDDHQLQLGRRFAAGDLVTLVESPEELGAALAADARDPAVPAGGAGALASDVESYLNRIVRRTPNRP